VFVFKDRDGDWYLEFEADCSMLTEDHLCGEYERRPLVCREHGERHELCEYHANEEPHEVRFSTAGEFEAWLNARGIDWRWKRKKAGKAR
jgi:Fe-S-cluster containining protein